MVKFLFDCDGTLVGSEDLAFEACCALVNEVLENKGVSERFTPKSLMQSFVGCSFRRMITILSEKHAFTVEADELESLVKEEEDRVIEKLLAEVEPCPGVNDVLARLTGKVDLAVVSSSALRRVRACLTKADQDRFFAAEHVYSAANSLPKPTSKPDPAIYLHAIADLGTTADLCVALEDSRSGVMAAAAAKLYVIGYVGSFPAHEREARARQLMECGAAFVINEWSELFDALERHAPAIFKELATAA
ncbi:MAG TPA: HAD family phosphatase [Candidatus Obscuribacterales bacterium]